MKITKHTKPFFKRTIFSVRYNKNIILNFTKNEYNLLPYNNDFEKEIINNLDGQHTVYEIFEILQDKNINCSLDDVLNFIKRLHDKYLLEYETIDEEERFSRQSLFWSIFEKNGIEYSKKIEKIIKDSSITVIGIGGFGSNIVLQLSYIGIGKIRLVDFDVVCNSNLNRQVLYKENNINENKLDVAENTIKSINSRIKVEKINKRISKSSDIEDVIKDSDLVFFTADTPRHIILDWANQVAVQTGTPFLFTLGVTPKFIRIGPLVSPESGICLKCFLPDIDFNHEIVKKINSNHVQGVILPYIYTATGIMVLEGLKYLTNFSKCEILDSIININLLNYSIKKEKISPNPNCKFYAKHNGIKFV